MRESRPRREASECLAGTSSNIRGILSALSPTTLGASTPTAFRSTALTALSREFIRPLKLQRIIVEGVSRRGPIFGFKWRVTSKRTRNQEGSWFTYVFEIVGKYPDGVSEEEFQIGYEMSQALADTSPAQQVLRPEAPVRAKIEITSGRASLEPPAQSSLTKVESNANSRDMRPFAPVDDDDIPF